MQQPLDDGRIDLWHVRLDEALDPGSLEECRAWLSTDELERLQRFTHVESRRQFLVGRALLRGMLSRYTGRDPHALEFRYNSYGKPTLKTPAEPPLEFSVSHTRGLVVCAVAACGALGVDVECARTVSNPLEFARRFFAPAEAAELASLPAARRKAAFLEFWTLREAFVKARGVGLMTAPADFAFSLSGPGEARVSFNNSREETPENWRFIRFCPTEGYRGALAVARPSSERPAISIRSAPPFCDWESLSNREINM